jgi:aspartate kinase
MPLVVQKYGGSSVADLAKLSRVADWVVACKRSGQSLVVVVSAMGKTTDELLTLAERAAKTGGSAHVPARRELDMLLSVGERTSMALLAIAIQARGEAAVSLTGSQSGIITTDRHFDARILEVRPERIEEGLRQGKIVIVAGYQGMSQSREITTLGRGGSDTTAVALAAALSADRCEIYSDVDGVYSADPSRVASARHLPELDFLTMQEMAESGAKVLHARAVEWARRKNIAICARKTDDFARQASGRETRIHAASAQITRAVVADGKLALLRCPLQAARSLLTACSELELPIRDAVQSESLFCVVLPLSLVPSPDAALEALRARVGDLRIERDVGMLSSVGVGVGSDAGQVGAFLRLLPVVPRLVVTTPLRLTAVLDSSALSDAEQALHSELVAA